VLQFDNLTLDEASCFCPRMFDMNLNSHVAHICAGAQVLPKQGLLAVLLGVWRQFGRAGCGA